MVAAAVAAFSGLSKSLPALPIWGVDLGPPTATSSPTPTASPSFSVSPTFTNSPTFSDSPTPTASNSPSPTALGTFTETCTFTNTPPFTPTPTFTATPTIGEGSYSVAFSPLVPTPAALVNGLHQDGFDIDYVSGSSSWTTGRLAIFFPLGLEAPNASNFYADSAFGGFVSKYWFIGQAAYVDVNNFPANSHILFHYGTGPGGILVSATVSAESLIVSSNPASQAGDAGILPVQASIPIVSATVTPTVTQTLTVTISPTFTISDTFTPTPTVTQTWTESPVAAEESGVFSYPNPFDMQKFDKCTFRFPADLDAKVTVFNLVGEPVRELPSADINGAQGWATWRGQDDYFHKVPGGLYYVRIRGKNTLVRKFTVLN
jgi:hypothetical protein